MTILLIEILQNTTIPSQYHTISTKNDDCSAENLNVLISYTFTVLIVLISATFFFFCSNNTQ